MFTLYVLLIGIPWALVTTGILLMLFVLQVLFGFTSSSSNYYALPNKIKFLRATLVMLEEISAPLIWIILQIPIVGQLIAGIYLWDLFVWPYIVDRYNPVTKTRDYITNLFGGTD